MWNLVAVLVLCLILAPLAYLLMIALASIKKPPPAAARTDHFHTFIITIAAHDEAAVIGQTIRQLRAQDYPPGHFSIHLVADHCSDATAEIARQAGAVVYERDSQPRGGKSAALAWLFEQIWQCDIEADAIVIFDADTVVESSFLRIMNRRIAAGDRVIQGQHIISNRQDGWYPMLTWAMFLIDNRYQNLGRANLGLSAKHMGDSICFQSTVLRQVGCGSGLTEDYQLRQRLLLENIRIRYEPAAKGYGEAPRTWTAAVKQRSRWLRGTRDANQQYASRLLRTGLRQRNLAMIDGALQAFLPSYSTLTLACGAGLALILLINALAGSLFGPGVVAAWIATAVLLFLYPYLGLALENAPLRAYLVILTGPAFIFWRTWLAIRARYLQKQVNWVRTQHGR